MKRAPIALATLLTFGITMTSGAVAAGPHDPIPVNEVHAPDTPDTPQELRARKIREMEAWLRRLVGNYKRYSGVSSTGVLRDEIPAVIGRPAGEGYDSFANCIGIGSGSGVHCIFGKISWPPGHRDRPVVVAGPKDYEDAGMIMLFGINPNASEIQMLIAFGSSTPKPPTTGLVVQASAELKDDTVEWRMRCANSSAESNCTVTYRITAPADGEYIQFTVSSSTQFKGIFHQFTNTSFLLPLVAGESPTRDKPPRISLYDDLLNSSKRPRGPH